MDATRAEVEKELKRLRNCLETARKEVKEQREKIRQAVDGDFAAYSVLNGADWLRSKEVDVRICKYAVEILQDILDKTKDTPSSGEVGK